jgi:hypothetical protein
VLENKYLGVWEAYGPSSYILVAEDCAIKSAGIIAGNKVAMLISNILDVIDEI